MFGFFKYIKSWFVKEVKIDIEHAMKIYITAKLEMSRSKGWVNPVQKELEFINKIGLLSCDLPSLKERGITYKPDRLNVGNNDIQWDYQFDTITTFTRNGGDCNSLNRISQMLKHSESEESFLVTYVCTDPKKNHTTCIYYSDTTHKWYSYDYGVEGKPCESFKESLDLVAKQYHAKIIHHVSQDIFWTFREI